MAECILGNVKIHVEVPLLLLFFSFFITDSVYTNLIIDRTCYTILGYNETECAKLGRSTDANTAKLEKIVEPHAAVINMVRSLTEQCFSVTICLFIGPWSDRFGRKPILLLPMTGFMLHFTLIAIFSYFPYISPWYFMICSIPSMLCGGGTTFITAVLAYITDVSSVVNRGLRMGAFEGIVAIGILLGNISSSYLFYATSYSAVFAVAAGCSLIAILFTVFLIPESLQNVETEGRVKGFFTTTNLVDMVKASIKQRENYNRAIILSCMFMLALYVFAIYGDGAVIFLYLREKFKWTLTKYTLYSSAHNIIWILGTIIGVYLFNKLLKISESILILVGFLSMMNSMLLQGLASRDWHIYVAGSVRCLGGVISPMIRSLVSKLVPVEEIGKIFSVSVAMESISGLLSTPVYTAIYNATINTNSGLFNFVTAGIYVFEAILVVFVIILQFKSPSVPYHELQNGHVINEDLPEENSE